MTISYDDFQKVDIRLGRITRAGDTATTCPNIQGGTNFFPTAYNPELGLAYAGGIEGCSDLSVREVDSADVVPGNIFIGGAGVNSGEQTGSINAVDVATGTIAATLNTTYPMYGGVMASADLLWAGHLDGTFTAYNASTLEELWSMNVGTSFSAAPISFLVNGKQYVAITGGGLGVSASAGAGKESGGEMGMVADIAQRMKMERVALSATVEAAKAENARMADGLAKALQEVAALQVELAGLRKVGKEARRVCVVGGAAVLYLEHSLAAHGPSLFSS